MKQDNEYKNVMFLKSEIYEVDLYCFQYCRQDQYGNRQDFPWPCFPPLRIQDVHLFVDIVCPGVDNMVIVRRY